MGFTVPYESKRAILNVFVAMRTHYDPFEYGLEFIARKSKKLLRDAKIRPLLRDDGRYVIRRGHTRLSAEDLPHQ